MKTTKLQLGKKEIEYLGRVISEKGISIRANRIKAFLARSEAECIKENCGLFGTLNHVRRFIDTLK